MTEPQASAPAKAANPPRTKALKNAVTNAEINTALNGCAERAVLQEAGAFNKEFIVAPDASTVPGTKNIYSGRNGDKSVPGAVGAEVSSGNQDPRFRVGATRDGGQGQAWKETANIDAVVVGGKDVQVTHTEFKVPDGTTFGVPKGGSTNITGKPPTETLKQATRMADSVGQCMAKSIALPHP
jgi:hypothetical protein